MNVELSGWSRCEDKAEVVPRGGSGGFVSVEGVHDMRSWIRWLTCGGLLALAALGETFSSAA